MQVLLRQQMLTCGNSLYRPMPFRRYFPGGGCRPSPTDADTTTEAFTGITLHPSNIPGLRSSSNSTIRVVSITSMRTEAKPTLLLYGATGITGKYVMQGLIKSDAFVSTLS
jgi:hypothetical protein